MKIESAAGEFEFDIEELKVCRNDVVLKGKMGVWEAETVMDRDDMIKLLKLTFGNLSFWVHIFKLPFYALSSRRVKQEETNG